MICIFPNERPRNCQESKVNTEDNHDCKYNLPKSAPLWSIHRRVAIHSFQQTSVSNKIIRSIKLLRNGSWFIVTRFARSLTVGSREHTASLWKREAWKKFRLQRDSNPWPLRYRCSALPTELWSHNCWEQVNFSGSIMPLRVIQHYSD